MKLISTLAVAASLFAGATANATPVTLDFENQASFLSLDLPESVYGFTANGALLAIANDAAGPYFSNNPSGSLVMFPTTPLAGELAALTSTLGFQDSATFFYSAQVAGTVYARDALGAVIGSVFLSANSPDVNTPFSVWTFATLNFSGLAASIDFSEVTLAAFDDVTVNPVPLPAAALMFPFALAAMRLATRKRREA